jgi:hypothetical protein
MAFSKEDIQAIAAELAAIEEAKQEALRKNSLWRRAPAATWNAAVTIISSLSDRIVIGFIIGLVIGVAASQLDMGRNKKVTPDPVNPPVVNPPDVSPPVALDADVKAALISVINGVLKDDDYETPAEFREAVRDELKKKGVTLPTEFQLWWEKTNSSTENTLAATRVAYSTLVMMLQK